MYIYRHVQSNAHKCLPYSWQRVEQILRDDYHCYLKPVPEAYKGNRYRGHVKRYTLINTDTHEIIADRVTLNAIRIIFTEEGYPLHPTEEELERIKESKIAPNKGAMEFLKFVEEQKKGK